MSGRQAFRTATLPGVSVLMSTYAGETAANLSESLSSVAGQSRPPDAVVLVVDGPVDGGQEAVIAEAGRMFGDLVVVRRSKSGGLARALNDGLAHCRHAFVLRMDSDDVCAPDRIAVQMAYLEAHPECDFVGSWSREFFEDGAPSVLKASPCGHDDLVRALRWRNVLVHPTVLVRAAALRAVGGYRARFGMLEDYDVFVRLVLAGARLHVIPKALVRVRSSLAQRTRRGGLTYLLREVAFRRELLRTGFLTLRQYVVITGLYAGFRIVSGPLRRQLYVLVRS